MAEASPGIKSRSYPDLERRAKSFLDRSVVIIETYKGQPEVNVAISSLVVDLEVAEGGRLGTAQMRLRGSSSSVPVRAEKNSATMMKSNQEQQKEKRRGGKVQKLVSFERGKKKV